MLRQTELRGFIHVPLHGSLSGYRFAVPIMPRACLSLMRACVRACLCACCSYSYRDEAMLLEQSRGQHPPTTSTNPTAPKPNPQLLRTSPESRPLTRSWHHGLVSNIGGTNPAFGPACRLAKRWVSVHMMSNHVCEEAVELLVAAAFTGLGPREQPGSRVAGERLMLHVCVYER